MFFDHRGCSRARGGPATTPAPRASSTRSSARRESDLEAVVDDVARARSLAKAAEVGALREQTLTENREALLAAAAELRARLRGRRQAARARQRRLGDRRDGRRRRLPRAARRRRRARSTSPRTRAILTALANDIGVEAIFPRQVIAYGRPGDVADRPLDQRQLRERDRGARRGAAARARDDRAGRLRRRAGRGRGPRGPRRRDPLRAHPAHPGGPGERLPRAAASWSSSVARRRRRGPGASVAAPRRVRRAGRAGGRVPPLRLPARARARPRRATSSTTRAAC